MKRLLYLDKKSKEIENLLLGNKNLIIRGANIKKYPYTMVHEGYRVYFMNNNNEDTILASATVKKATFLELSTLEQRETLLEELKDKLLLSKVKTDYIKKRKYISLFELEDIQKEYATLDHSQYGIVDDWMIIKEKQ